MLTVLLLSPCCCHLAAVTRRRYRPRCRPPAVLGALLWLPYRGLSHGALQAAQHRGILSNSNAAVHALVQEAYGSKERNGCDCDRAGANRWSACCWGGEWKCFGNTW